LRTNRTIFAEMPGMKEIAHGEKGRECLRTNRTIFAEMPGRKEMAHLPAWWRREGMLED
jgi:hypothetical protein